MQSSNPADFELKVKGVTSTGDVDWEDFEASSEKKKDKDDADGIERF